MIETDWKIRTQIWTVIDGDRYEQTVIGDIYEIKWLRQIKRYWHRYEQIMTDRDRYEMTETDW